MELRYKPTDRSIVAPKWHTLVLLALLLAPRSPLLEGTASSSKESRVWMYLGEFCFFWILFAIMYLGLRLSRTTLAKITGSFRTGKKELLSNVYWGLSFWLLYLVVAVVFVQSEHSRTDLDRFLPRILPRTSLDLALFIVVAISAGFCEEMIFRGYLQKQFYALTGNKQAALLIQAFLFGAAHGYHQTAMEFGNNVAFGIAMGFLAEWRRNLIPCISAHIASDLLAGVLSFFERFAS
jgi:uncharacterized protein